MRTKRISKLLVAVLAVLMVLSTLALPVFAESTIDMDRLAMTLTTSSAFESKDFSPNDVVRTLVNTIVGLIAVVGLLWGAYQFATSFSGDDPKERRNGISAMVASLVIGGLIITVINMILA